MSGDGRGRKTVSAVALIDVLGSTAVLEHGTAEELDEYFRNMRSFYDRLEAGSSTQSVETFSDTAILYSDDVTQDGLLSFISAVALFQFDTVCLTSMFVRGGISKDTVYHYVPEPGSDRKEKIMGRAVAKAHRLESKEAIYPVVAIDNDIVSSLKGSANRFVGKMSYGERSMAFVDYLQVTKRDGFVDSELLENHANALRRHVEDDNDSKRAAYGGLSEWDHIRSKDVWILSYHNYFCEINDMVEYKLSFVEEYDEKYGCPVIRLEGGEHGGVQ